MLTAQAVVRTLMEEDDEWIQSCAIRINRDKIVTGSFHAGCLSDAVYKLKIIPVDDYEYAMEAEEDIPGFKIEAGFTTNTGRFVGRREAYKIARRNAQCDADRGQSLMHDMIF